MNIKELAVKQIAQKFAPLLADLSDESLGRFLALVRRVAPTDFSRSFIDGIDRLRINHDPMIDLVKRVIQQNNPRARERIINNLLIKELMQGDAIRRKLTEAGNPYTLTFLISPTMRCNLRCPGCYASQYSRQDDLEMDVIDRIVTEGEEMGIFIVTILGGEPFVRPEIMEICRSHPNVYFQFFTNGTLLTEELAAEMARMGNVMVTISLEGFEDETDARRGPGVFRKAMQGMDLLREQGVPFGFSAMITRHNLETIISDSFNDMLIEKGCLIGWHFLHIPAGKDPDMSLMPTPEQREILRQRGARYIRKRKPILLMDFWNDAPVVGGCIAGGKYYFHINARGDVEPCIFVHLATENIKHKPLREAVNSPFFRAIRARQPFSHNLLRPCMIIDNPQELRDFYREFQPYSTDGESCGLVTTLACDLDKYSQEAARILDPVWEHELAVRSKNQDSSEE